MDDADKSVLEKAVFHHSDYELPDGLSKREADHSKRVTPADYHMAHIALCFGLNDRSARQRALEQGYLERMMDIEFLDPCVQTRYAGMKKEVEKFLHQ